MTKLKKAWKWIAKNIKGLFCGSDGMLSWRRTFGILLCVYGAIELHNAEPPTSDTIVMIVWTFRGGIAILGGLVLAGIVTVQNIKEIVSKSKGKDDV